MTAEEKLKEWYKQNEPVESYNDGVNSILIAPIDSMCLAPEHIDLIANLVVERLLKNKRSTFRF